MQKCHYLYKVSCKYRAKDSLPSIYRRNRGKIYIVAVENIHNCGVIPQFY
jgi:hypothetical protein